MKNFSKLTKRALDSLSKSFQASYNNYFSEADIQYELFNILKSIKEINIFATSLDNKKICLIHPEYPSVERIKTERGKGYRVWFDLAILNPKFIKKNNYQTIFARDEKDAKLWGENLLAAFEIKLFNRYQAGNINLINQDCLKLSLCKEIKNKYLLVFSKYEPEKNELNNICSKGIKIFWSSPKKTIKI